MNGHDLTLRYCDQSQWHLCYVHLTCSCGVELDLDDLPHENDSDTIEIKVSDMRCPQDLIATKVET